MIPHHAPFAGATFISGCSAEVGGSGQSSKSAGKSLGNTYVSLYQGFTWWEQTVTSVMRVQGCAFYRLQYQPQIWAVASCANH